MNDKAMYVLVTALLTFLLAIGLCVVANLEAARRILALERSVDAIINTQAASIQRIDNQFQTMIEADRENERKLRSLDDHVDFFLKGEWK